MLKGCIRYFIVLLVVSIGACSDREMDLDEDALKACIHLNKNDPVPEYDTYFTWDDFDPEVTPDWAYAEEHVRYFLDGKPVGRGRIGFGHIIQHINEMPQGSRVLVFPSYDFPELADYSGNRCRVGDGRLCRGNRCGIAIRSFAFSSAFSAFFSLRAVSVYDAGDRLVCRPPGQRLHFKR